METTTTSLAQEPDCRLGGVHISPSRGLIWNSTIERRVRPQVMQALLVLLRAKGRTVTRDELVDACWEGRIVSDDAINRVVALARGIARQFEPPPFHLETIPKIGFRLNAAGPEDVAADESIATDLPSGTPAAQPTTATSSRRAVVGAASAAVLAGVGGVGWWSIARRAPEAARAEIQRGLTALRQSTPDQVTQAIAAFQHATTLAPRHAEGWAWLAVAYTYQSRYGARTDRSRVLAQRAEEAANRALAIEPGNAEAEAALAALHQTTDWKSTASTLHALRARHPRSMVANLCSMDFYTSTGQLELAVRCATAGLAADPAWLRFFPVLTQLTWSIGRLNEADDWIARGFAQWPRHYSVWFVRQRLLTYTGRATEALAMIDDVDGRPVGIPEWNFDLCKLESQALLTHAPGDIAAAAAAYRDAASRGVGFVQNAMQFLAATGQLEEAFAMLNALLFDGSLRLPSSRYSTEQGQYYNAGHWETWILWMPQLAPMRADPRMLPIVRNIGLTDYWRAASDRPVTPIAGF